MDECDIRHVALTKRYWDFTPFRSELTVPQLQLILSVQKIT